MILLTEYHVNSIRLRASIFRQRRNFCLRSVIRLMPSVSLAAGELFATRVLGANRISLLCMQSNITFAAAKISRCRRQHITKNYQEMRTYSPPNAVAQMKNSRYGIKSISAVLLSFGTRCIFGGGYYESKRKYSSPAMIYSAYLQKRGGEIRPNPKTST